MGSEVTMVVKARTFFEGATPDDAHLFGLDKTVDRMVTPKGFFAPREASGDLYGVFLESDLIIYSQGDGQLRNVQRADFRESDCIHARGKMSCHRQEDRGYQGQVVVKLDDPGDFGFR